MTVPKRTKDRVGAATLMLILVSTGRGSSYSLFRCRFDSIARRACCCPMEGGTSAPARKAAAVSSSCCDIETVTIAPSGLEAARLDTSRALPSLAPLAHLPSLPQRAGPDADFSTVIERARGSGPPLTLLNCSLLI